MDTIKKFFRTIKNFFLAVGITIKKGCAKVFSPEIKGGLKRVGRMFGAVLGVFARILMVALLILVMTGAILGVFGAIYVTKYIDVNTDIILEQFDVDQTSFIWAADPDNEGEYILLATLSGKENRIWVSYDEIPQNMLDAVVAIEDKRFWDHDGVDWRRTVGAFLSLAKGDSSYGGSTITQQLIKNTTGDNDATVSRKINEIFRALSVEKKYPGISGKEFILESYLNTVYFGSGCYGVLTAADEYYGKSLDELTIAECAALIGITNNPSYYNPYTNPKNNKKRQEVILREMYDQGLITLHEYNIAKYQPLEFKRKEGLSSGETLNSWFISRLILDVTEDLAKEWNISKAAARYYLLSSGCNIYATIDVNMQKIMDDIWADDSCWPKSPDAEPPEAAMMIVDQRTGEIKAMIGGREKTGNSVFDRSTDAKRSPGSAIKPLTVYAPAFDLGLLNPYSPVDDIPVRDYGRAWPRNSPVGYSGRMNVLEAVTVSKNTVACAVVEKVGYERCFEYGKERFGLSTLVESKTVGNEVFSDLEASPLGMGSLTDGATVREMTGGYAAIANGGVRNKTRTYTHITDQNGGIVFENRLDPVVAIKPKTAFYLETCLINVVTSGTGTYAKINNMPTAGKTGTTSSNMDRWFAGYTPYYTAVCWFGYDIGRDMSYYNNNRPGNPALHMWKQVMSKVHEDLEYKDFERPGDGGIETFKFCIDSGLPQNSDCHLDPRGSSRTAAGLLDRDDIPRSKCNVHKATYKCTVSGYLATPYCSDETRSRIALLDYKRWSPVAGYSQHDEQYTLRTWGVDHAAEAPDGFFAVISTGTDGKRPLNAFCDYCETHGPQSGGENPGGEGTGDPSGEGTGGENTGDPSGESTGDEDPADPLLDWWLM